jgi:hypothetical protein
MYVCMYVYVYIYHICIRLLDLESVIPQESMSAYVKRVMVQNMRDVLYYVCMST